MPSAIAEALTAFARGDQGPSDETPPERTARLELAEDGAWYIANALVNLEICARFVGKKDAAPAPGPIGGVGPE